MDDTKRYKILVVDDNKELAEFLNVMLQKDVSDIDCAVTVRTSLEDALAVINDGFDLVITDFALHFVKGKESGGEVVAAAVRAHNTRTPVLLCSGSLDPGSTTEIIELCQANDYITKPFQIVGLLAKVKKLLGIDVSQPAAS